MRWLAIFTMLLSVPALAADAHKGEALFNSRACTGCHAIGSQGSATTGPNLAGVLKRRSESWLRRWIKAPDQMSGDPIVQKLKAQYKTDMPNLGLTDDEVQSLILYLKQKDGS